RFSLLLGIRVAEDEKHPSSSDSDAMPRRSRADKRLIQLGLTAALILLSSNLFAQAGHVSSPVLAISAHPCGTIKPGQCADLVLLDGDPLEDVQNISRLAGVVVRGPWLPPSELQRLLRSVRERPGNYRRQLSSQ